MAESGKDVWWLSVARMYGGISVADSSKDISILWLSVARMFIGCQLQGCLVECWRLSVSTVLFSPFFFFFFCNSPFSYSFDFFNLSQLWTFSTKSTCCTAPSQSSVWKRPALSCLQGQSMSITGQMVRQSRNPSSAPPPNTSTTS